MQLERVVERYCRSFGRQGTFFDRISRSNDQIDRSFARMNGSFDRLTAPIARRRRRFERQIIRFCGSKQPFHRGYHRSNRAGRNIKLITVQEILDELHVQKM